MDDRISAEVVECFADNTGKLWININGECAVRVGYCKLLTMENHIYGRSVINFDKEAKDGLPAMGPT